MLLHTTETPNETFSRFCTLQKDQKEFFMLLLTSETPTGTFWCFCTRQKRQMKLFRASAHCRKAKKNFFMLLHASERPKRSFSRFCILQKGQKEDFRCRRKSFPEWFGISAYGESRFPNGLVFPRSAKIFPQQLI